MTRKNSPTSRILAIVALLAAVAVVFAVVTGNGDSSDKTGKAKQSKAPKKRNNGGKENESKAKTYEVKEGDTLTAIAQETGVTVDELRTLNPGLDPQVLIAGQKLKLR